MIINAIYKSSFKMWKNLLVSEGINSIWVEVSVPTHPQEWGGRRVEKGRAEVLYGWATLTPFVRSILGLQAYPSPPQPWPAWPSFNLLTRNAPKPETFSINLYPCPHLIQKLEECLLLSYVVIETPRGRKPSHCCWCIQASPLACML